MPGPLRVNDRLTIPENELQWKFSRSGGPGGQSVNTSDSRVELFFDVLRSVTLPEFLRERALQRLGDRLSSGVLTVNASEHRSQLKNRQEAERRMASLLATALAPPPPARRSTKPSKGAKKARMDDKRRRGDVKRLRRSTDD